MCELARRALRANESRFRVQPNVAESPFAIINTELGPLFARRNANNTNASWPLVPNDRAKTDRQANPDTVRQPGLMSFPRVAMIQSGQDWCDEDGPERWMARRSSASLLNPGCVRVSL
jgi:hypothetical protein